MTKQEEMVDEQIHKKLGLAYYVLKVKPAQLPPRLWYPALNVLLHIEGER